jgi:hypothetical protein
MNGARRKEMGQRKGQRRKERKEREPGFITKGSHQTMIARDGKIGYVKEGLWLRAEVNQEGGGDLRLKTA